MGGRQNTSVRRLDYTEKEWNSKRADWEVIAAVCNSVNIVRFQLKGTLSDKQFSEVEAVYGDWEIQRVGAVNYAKVGTLYSNFLYSVVFNIAQWPQWTYNDWLTF